MYATVLAALLLFASGVETSGNDRPLPYYLMEELPANTLIGNIAVDAKLSYAPVIKRQLQYTIHRQVNEAGDAVRLFDVDRTSSIIKTTVQIDRDVICPHMDSCLVYLDIQVSHPEVSRIIQTTVDILDVNDHAPRFQESMIYKKVPESVAPGTTISIPAALDPDSSEYNIKQYEIISSALKFELKVHPRTNRGPATLALVIKEKLDREEATFYQFKVVAYDGGNPPKFGAVLVNIQVEDSNDNDPKFENTTYEVFVMENTPADTTIGKVNARDLDFGENAALSYSFSGLTQQNYGNVFGIVEDTGAVYLKVTLDFEVRSTYLLTVVAKDHGPNSSPAHATVIVRVEDDNDHPPHISINTRTASGKAIIAEDSQVGSFVAHISVEDLDGGDNGRVKCILGDSGSGIFALQDMYQTQYDIVTISRLHREVQRTFLLVVSCSDQGKNRLTSTASLNVDIIDSNDHPPKFSQRVYTITMEEHNLAGDFIAVVTATDPDEGKNGEVRYTIHPDVSDSFTIDSQSGIIITNSEFDREVTHTVEIKVIAYDLGAPTALSSTATILLTIIDIDDNPPVFTQQQYQFGTYENQLPGAEVGPVEATDKDGISFNEFQYKLLQSANQASRTFSIDPVSGQIYTRRILDRETQPVYYMTVVAESSTSNLSGTASVTVYVADKNDNFPYVSWPTQTNNTVFVSNETPKGHNVAKIEATDQDLGNNGKLEYSLVNGEEEDVFDIDAGTGVISIKKDVSVTTYKVYKLDILVRDLGFPEMMTPTHLNIVVNNSITYKPEPVDASSDFNNTTIVVSLTSASLLLVFLLVIAIVLIKKQSQEKKAIAYANSTEPSKVPGRKEAQTMLTPREDTPDGKECTEWSTPGMTGHHNRTSGITESYYQQGPGIQNDIKIPIDENDINLQLECRKIHNEQAKRLPKLTIHDILKSSSSEQGRLSLSRGAFSRPLTSPRCLTLTSPPDLDDPVLQEVKVQSKQNIDQSESSTSARSATLQDSVNSKNMMLQRDFNALKAVSNA